MGEGPAAKGTAACTTGYLRTSRQMNSARAPSSFNSSLFMIRFTSSSSMLNYVEVRISTPARSASSLPSAFSFRHATMYGRCVSWATSLVL